MPIKSVALAKWNFFHFAWFIDKLSYISVNLLLISELLLIKFRGEGVKLIILFDTRQ